MGHLFRQGFWQGFRHWFQHWFQHWLQLGFRHTRHLLIQGKTLRTIPEHVITIPEKVTCGWVASIVLLSLTACEGPPPTPGITVSPTSNLVTSETGRHAEFTIVLTSEPKANVTIELESDHPDEGEPGPTQTQVVFNSSNWKTPQVIRVIGLDDSIVDGDVRYSIETLPASSSDTAYNGMNPNDVQILNLDDDGSVPGKPTARIVVSAAALQTSETGDSASFSVVLSRAPATDSSVKVSAVSDDPTEASVSPPSYEFTSLNWSTEQSFTVTGIDDNDNDGNISYSVLLNVTSDDPDFDRIVVNPVLATNIDNESPPPAAGVLVNPSSGLETSENLGSATFTVRLNSPPSATVTLQFSSSDPTEAVVTTDPLQFTASNYTVPQTVSITGVNDSEIDGTISYQVTISATSADLAYSNLAIPAVQLSNLDNDPETPAAVTIHLVNGNTTTEAGGSLGFTVALSKAPVGTATVTLSATSGNPSEGRVTPSSVSFDADNWSQPQTFTVTGQDDSLDDGDVSYQIEFSAESLDGAYNGIAITALALSNRDDDSAGFTITTLAGLTTSEDLTTASFRVQLTALPLTPVTLNIQSSDSTEAIANPTQLVFNSSNWNVDQNLDVTGQDDNLPDGNISYQIQFSVSADPANPYSALSPPPLNLTNLDNEPAGVSISPNTDLLTSESLTSATFTLVLNTQPSSDVTLTLSSSDPSEGLVAPNNPIFTPANWSIPQTVTVSGQDDSLADGDIDYQIRVTASASQGNPYNGIAIIPVALRNTDNEQATVTLSANAGLITSEDLTSVSFNLSLAAEPTADVQIAVSSSNTNEAIVSPSTLTFTSGTWSQAQTITVTGQNDNLSDGTVAYQVRFAVSSSPGNPYQTATIAALNLQNLDNEVAGFIITPVADLTTAEPATNTSFTVALTSPPMATVSIGISSSDTSEGIVLPNTLSFTSADWSSPQTVTVSGQDDDEADGNISYQVQFSVSAGLSDPYNGLVIAPLPLRNSDNEQPTVIIAPTTGLVTSEALTTDSFTVALGAKPVANSSVTIEASSSNTGEGLVSPSSVSFNASDWNLPKTFTVTGVDDTAVDGAIAYQINLNAISAVGNPYNGVAVSPVQATNQDNDTLASTFISVSALDLTTAEDGRHITFSVRLHTQPNCSAQASCEVAIDAVSNDPSEGLVSPTTIVFSPNNWQQPQIYTVRGVPDTSIDGDLPYQVAFTSRSQDARFNAANIPPLALTNLDDDGGAALPTPSAPNFTLFIEPGKVDITNASGGLSNTLAARVFSFTTSTTSTPGPVLELTEGQNVILEIVNDHVHDHSFEIAQVFTDPQTIVAGDSRRYLFTAPAAGIYLFNDTRLLDRSLGLFGSMVVKPATAYQAWSGGPSYDRERNWIITDMDSRWLADPENPTITNNYNPDYFLLNAMSGFAAKNVPSTMLRGVVGEVILLRIANAGQYDQSLHFPANHSQVISQNGLNVANVAEAPRMSTVNVKRGSSAMLLFTPDKPGSYLVQVHSAQMGTGNGVYLNGVMTQIVVQ